MHRFHAFMLLRPARVFWLHAYTHPHDAALNFNPDANTDPRTARASPPATGQHQRTSELGCSCVPPSRLPLGLRVPSCHVLEVADLRPAPLYVGERRLRRHSIAARWRWHERQARAGLPAQFVEAAALSSEELGGVRAALVAE